MQGEFWFVDESRQVSNSSPHLIDGTEVILADIWERNVWSGRVLKMIIFDDTVRLSRRELDMVHKTWDTHVRPHMTIASHAVPAS
jgi:hypothetical protein